MSAAYALRQADLARQSRALASGETSAEALAAAYLAAIQYSGARINAYIAVDPERVLADARASDARRREGCAGVLEGLAIAVKDNIDVAGYVTTAGMATRRDRAAAAHDAPAIARLRAAGAVLLGKLNLHEAALGADNDNPHFGACHHPQRHGYTPGGSSGGAGAAVAAGLCSAAVGTDSMGSVRIPASYCGVYGLKPGNGVISPRGSVAVARRLDTIGVLARAPADLARLLQTLAGFDAGCAQSDAMAAAAISNGATADDPPSSGPGVGVRERLGVPSFSMLGVDPEVVRAFDQARRCIAALGHALVDLPPPDPLPGRVRRAGLLLCEAEMLVEHASDWHARRALFSPPLARLLAWAEQRPAAELAAADRLLDAAQVQMQRWLSNCDLLLWPTTPQTAFAFSDPVPDNQADLTCFANFAGVPALSLPLPVAPGALPIGLQLIGRRGDEARLLVLAGQLAAAFAGQAR